MDFVDDYVKQYARNERKDIDTLSKWVKTVGLFLRMG